MTREEIKKRLLENWGIKLLSLVLSLSLWFYATSKGKSEITLTVPIELRNVPQNMAVVGDVPGSLEVRLQGQERVLRDITIGKRVVCLADLSITRAGENIVRISPDDIKRPSGTAITYLSKSEILVKLEPLMRKSFRLRPVLYGAPEAGYRVDDVSVTPARITVEGPAGVVREIRRLQTMPVDIQGAREDLLIEPRIDYQGKQVKIIDKNITLHIGIERKRK
jgi:YbbR domain-containing protein